MAVIIAGELARALAGSYSRSVAKTSSESRCNLPANSYFLIHCRDRGKKHHKSLRRFQHLIHLRNARRSHRKNHLRYLLPSRRKSRRKRNCFFRSIVVNVTRAITTAPVDSNSMASALVNSNIRSVSRPPRRKNLGRRRR